MVGVDPLASLSIFPIVVTLGDVEYTVEGHPAADWVALLLGNRTSEIIPGWVETEPDRLALRIFDGEVTEQELDEAIQDVITVASGRPWWWTIQFIAMIASKNEVWSQFHGTLIMHGVDANRISLAAWTEALYSAVANTIKDQEQRQNFDNTLNTRPPTVPIDEEEEGATFLALMNGGGFAG